MESCITLTREDLRQALLRHVRFRDMEQAVLQQARLPSAERTSASALFLLRRTDPELADMLSQWMQGSVHLAAVRQTRLSEAVLVPFAPRGISVPAYLRQFAKNRSRPVIAVDAAAAEIGAALCYAASLYYGLQVPVSAAFMHAEELEKEFRFSPGDFLPELAVFCLQHKIPLIPLNRPPRIVASEMQLAYNQLVHQAHTQFIEEIRPGQTARQLEARAAALVQQIFSAGLHLVVEREDMISQSCYLASRLVDLSRFLAAGRYKTATVLALYRMTNCLDFPALVKTFARSPAALAEMYEPVEPQHDGAYALRPAAAAEETRARATSSSLSDKLSGLVQRYLDGRMQERLSRDQVDRLTALLAEALRRHPLVQRPPGVRGTLAMREIAQAYGLIRKKITRAVLARAAVLALSHRTRVRDSEDADPAQVFKALLSRIIYNIPLDAVENEQLPQKRRPLTADEAAQALQGLTDAALRTLAPDEAMPVDDPAFAEEAMKHPLVQQALKDAFDKGLLDNAQAACQDLMQELADRDHLAMADATHQTLSKEGKRTLKEKLEEALAKGEITPEQLAEALKHARSMPAPAGLGGDKMRLSPQAETELLAELMDFQHQGRSSSSSLEDLYVHYTVNEKKGMGVLSDKVDYEKLKVMLHQLEQKGLVRLSGENKRYSLSHLALKKLLEGLIQREKGQLLEQRAFKKEHETDKTDVRRYRRGDMFRDISIRHTLRRVLRKAKTFEDINYTDLRSFEKKPARQLDIAVCVDISESMKHSGKLRYAKMAVAELAKAATGKNDRVGVIAFSNLGQIVVPLTDKITPLLEAAMTLRAEQYTNIGNGLRCARRMLLKGKNSNAKYVILITDGQPNAALSDEYEDTSSYHARVAAYSRQTSMETKRALGTHHAIVEASLTRRQHIKISVVYIATEGKEDEESERTARDIARIGNGRFHKVNAIERLPLEALAMVG